MAEAEVEGERCQDEEEQLRVRVRFVLRCCTQDEDSPDCPQGTGSVQGAGGGLGKGKGLPAVLGSPEELGSWQHSQALRAAHVDSHWVAEAWLPTGVQVRYVWVTVGAKNCLSHCDVMPPRLLNVERCPCVVLTAWGMADHTVVADLVRVEVRTVLRCEEGERLAVGGTGPLGQWDPHRAVLARQYPSESGFWSAELEVGRDVPERWKWVLLDNQGRPLRWEHGRERLLVARADYQVVSAPWGEEERLMYQQDGCSGSHHVSVLQEQGTCTGDNLDYAAPCLDIFHQSQQGTTVTEHPVLR